jgi:hypothetical protein
MAKRDVNAISKGRAAKGKRETESWKPRDPGRVVLASGRSGSAQPLAMPDYGGMTLSGGRVFGTQRSITEAGQESGRNSADSGTERVTVRSGKDSSRTYTTKGKYADGVERYAEGGEVGGCRGGGAALRGTKFRGVK